MSNTKQIITEIIREEIEKFYIESSSNALAEIPEIAEDEIVEFEMTEDMVGSGGFKKRLRKVGGLGDHLMVEMVIVPQPAGRRAYGSTLPKADAALTCFQSLADKLNRTSQDIPS